MGKDDRTMKGQGRAKAKTSRYRRILWPTDFSPLAKAAIPHALGVAAPRGAELIVLHVLSRVAVCVPPAASGSIMERLDRETRAAAQDQLRQAAEKVQARARGIRIRNLLVYGSPFLQIPRVAKRLKCDLIVLATHGRTGLRHVLMGSVAENIVRQAACPVLTVRPAKPKR